MRAFSLFLLPSSFRQQIRSAVSPRGVTVAAERDTVPEQQPAATERWTRKFVLFVIFLSLTGDRQFQKRRIITQGGKFHNITNYKWIHFVLITVLRDAYNKVTRIQKFHRYYIQFEIVKLWHITLITSYTTRKVKWLISIANV